MGKPPEAHGTIVHAPALQPPPAAGLADTREVRASYPKSACDMLPILTPVVKPLGLDIAHRNTL